jgi:hypothetical protein
MATHERNTTLAFLSAIFALMFGLVSGFGCYMLYSEVNSVLRPLTWTQGNAQIAQVRLNESASQKGGSTYSVSTQYRYEHAGKTYFGNTIRVGDFGADDDKAYHTAWVTLLQEAKSLERALPVFINPDAPTQSALSNQVRWRNVWFALPFIFLFGAVAIGAAAMTLSTLGFKINLNKVGKKKVLPKKR